MVALAQSLEQFLRTKYPERYERIKNGHIEDYDTIRDEYYVWCETDEGKKYVAGGEFFDDT